DGCAISRVDETSRERGAATDERVSAGLRCVLRAREQVATRVAAARNTSQDRGVAITVGSCGETAGHERYEEPRYQKQVRRAGSLSRRALEDARGAPPCGHEVARRRRRRCRLPPRGSSPVGTASAQ